MRMAAMECPMRSSIDKQIARRSTPSVPCHGVAAHGKQFALLMRRQWSQVMPPLKNAWACQPYHLGRRITGDIFPISPTIEGGAHCQGTAEIVQRPIRKRQKPPAVV